MEDRETARMRKYGENKRTRIMMATVPHVTSGLGLRKFQADVFLLTRVYNENLSISYTCICRGCVGYGGGRFKCQNLSQAHMTWSLSQCPHGLSRGSAASRLLRVWVRIPPESWMSVSCDCCVLSGRGLCVGLISRPEESYRVWCF